MVASRAMPETATGALTADARAALLGWYAARGRSLAFRRSRDPYAILVSEVMAQQTQISRVIPAWEAFLGRFPTVAALAAASPADVIRAWRGMGYNRRALNLQRAAAAIVRDHEGRVPGDVAALERLPGIGPYTARAVAAIAFGRPVGAVDTNVRRVIRRVLAIGDDAATSVRLQAAADASLDRARPGDWTHALMDLGATICRPRGPRCEDCPIAAWCASAGRSPEPTRRVRLKPADIPFTATSRWLRGRILDELRSAQPGAWTRLGAPIGIHDDASLSRALSALEKDGLVELHPARDGRARLAGA